MRHIVFIFFCFNYFLHFVTLLSYCNMRLIQFVYVYLYTFVIIVYIY